MDAKTRYKAYYQHMFAALQNNDRAEANRYRALMEQLRQSHLASHGPSIETQRLPPFARAVLNKTQAELGITEASNCINAAFNFHAQTPVLSPYSTMDFLNVIRTQYLQLKDRHQLEFGDLVVFWSRSHEDWKDRTIDVQLLDPEAPGFPFGLVFDHVAVYVGQNALFHKPDPTMTSRYQINHWDDLVGFNEVISGFELTFHRSTTRASAE